MLTPAAAVPPGSGEVRRARLSGAQLLTLAERAETGGDVALAERALRALLNDEMPKLRNEARFRLARLLSGRGDRRDAALLLRRILDDEPGAARVRLELAALLERAGDEAAARRELRAALASRPPAALARLIDRYAAALRDRRPYGAVVRVAIAPDSNINRATAESQLDTVLGEFDIASDAKARSGLGLMVDGAAFARLALSDDISLIGRAGAATTRYRDRELNRLTLSGRAGVQVDRNRSRLSLSLTHQRHAIGGKTYIGSTGLEGDWQRPLAGTAQLQLSVGAARLDNRLNSLEDGWAFTAGAATELALSPAAGVGISLGGQRRTARDRAYANHSAQLGLFGWHEVGHFTLYGSTSAGMLRADERLSLLPERRRDRSWSLEAGVTARRLEWLGFAPSLSFRMERTRSNVAFHDHRRRSLQLGVTRAF